MAWLKTKEVRMCICGKEPGSTVTRTDRNQAFAIMVYILGPILPLLIILSALDGTFIEEWQDLRTKIVSTAYVIALFFLVYFTFRTYMHGHSLKCSLRQAFFKIT